MDKNKPVDLTDMALVVVKLGIIGQLNEIELKILTVLKEDKMPLRQISQRLNVDYKNTWRYCRKLYSLNLIKLEPPPEKSLKGSKVFAILNIN